MILMKKKSGAWPSVVLGLGTVLVLTVATFAARASEPRQTDRRMTMGEAQRLAATSGSVIPITVNEQVLAELNHYVGTVGGRNSLRDALTRMRQYRQMIEDKIERYQFPEELLSVPVVESGYQNTLWAPGAGLWGFIKQTARNYDLVVNEQVDERLDEAKETEAAMKYFRDLHNLFNDWRLALRGYNNGESHVAKLIKKHGTRDAWELERLAPSKERYLAKVTAVIILMKNPSALD